jgi:hypothetical protein
MIATDLLLLISSYCDLEDFLILLKNKYELRDTSLKIYPRDLVSIATAVENDWPFSIRYLISLQKEPTEALPLYAVKKGYLDIIQSLESYIINYPSLLRIAIINGHLHIVKYFISLGFKVNSMILNLAYITAKVDICKYFWELGYIPKDEILDNICTDTHI